MAEMADPPQASEQVLRTALERNGQRFSEQRLAVYRYLAGTTTHPTADEVLGAVRSHLPGISLATVYKSLETLVGCGLAAKLTYSDGSARYDGRTDPHPHVRCVACGSVSDLPGRIPQDDLSRLRSRAGDFRVTGYRLEFTGYCPACDPTEAGVPA